MFLTIPMKYVVFMSLRPCTIKITSDSKIQPVFLKIYWRGRPFLTVVTRWSRSTSNFYALITQNLTDEFMPKIYPAS